MFNYIQKNFGYSNYEIAQLRYCFKVYAAELSKIFIIGAFFFNNIPVYLWTLLIFRTMRQATGGLHMKSYISCLFVSWLFFILSINILPNLYLPRLVQLIILLICILLSHHIGPVVSRIHVPLSEEAISKAKLRLITTILIYMLLLFIFPESIYITAGFWIIVLNTLQLIVAKTRKEANQHHEI